MRVARWFSISRLEYSWRHVVGPCPSYGITSLYTVEPSHSLSCCEFTQTISHGPLFVPSLKEIEILRRPGARWQEKAIRYTQTSGRKYFVETLAISQAQKNVYSS